MDCMIALPGQLFYTTQIPVCLWFLTKDKRADRGARLPQHERARRSSSTRARWARMISRTQKELDEDDIAAIARTYHAWRGEARTAVYEDEAGLSANRPRWTTSASTTLC